MRILLETDNAIVNYDEMKKAMVVVWSSAAEKDEFYLVYNNILKGFKIFFAHTLMLDFRKVGKIERISLNYLVKQVFPMAAKCGMRKLVLISIDEDDQNEISKSFSKSGSSFAGKVSIETAHNFEEAFSRLAV